MLNNNDWLIVGVITSVHGLDGKLKIKSLSDFDERFTKPGQRWLQKNQDEPILFELISGFKQPGKEIFIVKFKNIDNRTQAESLRNYKFLTKNDDIPKLKKGEFHISQLINLKVKIFENNELKVIGEVFDFDNEKNSLLKVKLIETNKEVLIPFVNEIIPKVDLENKFLIITPPKGLLEL
jgi:16S rRNA processing protein RimM